jgi:hypothetical protein
MRPEGYGNGMDPLGGLAITAGLSLGFVAGRLRAALVPLATLACGALAQQISLASNGHWTSTEDDIVGASVFALLAVLVGVGIRALHRRYYDKGTGPHPPFAQLPGQGFERRTPGAPPGFDDESYADQDPITRRAWAETPARRSVVLLAFASPSHAEGTIAGAGEHRTRSAAARPREQRS